MPEERILTSHVGSLPRIGFSFYVKDRMTGFGGIAKRGTVTDFANFPGDAALKTTALEAAKNNLPFRRGGGRSQPRDRGARVRFQQLRRLGHGADGCGLEEA